MKNPNHFNLEDWNKFFNVLLIEADEQKYNDYFDLHHKMVINDRNFMNGEFKKRMAWFRNNQEVESSSVEVKEIFYNDDHHYLFERHITKIKLFNSSDIKQIQVTSIMTFAANGKIASFYDVSAVINDDNFYHSKIVKLINHS